MCERDKQCKFVLDFFYLFHFQTHIWIFVLGVSLRRKTVHNAINTLLFLKQMLTIH